MDMPNNILTSLVQTRSIERVLAPIAAQVSQLIILNDSSQRNGELLPDLVPNAEAVMRATEDLIQVSQKLATETADEELKREIPKACESIGLAGKGMLLATQRLHMEGQSMEARNEMVKTARNVLQGTMKVLLVSDDAEVRKIIKASHWLLDRLTLLQSVQTMKALVTCFKGFTEALMLLSNLTDKRQKELTNPKQREYVLSAMTALKKSAPMLSTSMQTYVKFPNNPQSKTSKDYVVGQVITAVEDLISAVKMTENTATEGLEEPGMFTTRISKVCRHLSQDHRMMLNSDFEALMESIVRHSMAVASVSRERVRNQIVDTCKEILKQSNDITSQAKSLKENLNFHQLKEDFNKSCDVLISEFKSLEKHINQSLGYQVVDTLLETTEPFDRLVKAAVVPLQDKSVLREKLCIDMLQPLEEAFHDYSDKLIQFGGFIAASCADKRKVHYLRAVLNRLECLDPEVYPACLVARRDVLDRGALEHVKLLRREWHDEISTLVNIIDDMSDPYTFIELSESSMKSDVRECREAILISDSDMLATAANHLLGRGKRVVQVANKVVESHIDPIYRNGLQSYVNQLQKAIPLVKNAAYETVSLIDNSRLHDKLRERCEILLLCVSRVKEGLDEDTHPSILSPLRNNVRPKKKPMVTDYPDYPSPHDSMRSGDHNMYLSKPVPSIPDIAAAANPTNMSMYTSMNRPRSATHHPVTSPKSAIIALDVPVEFVNLITDLLKAIEKGDKIQIEMMCGVILTRTSNYKTMVDVIARLSEDSTKISALQANLSEMTAILPELFELARNTSPKDESNKAHLFVQGQEWARKASILSSTIMDIIGPWSTPAEVVANIAKQGDTNRLQSHIETLNNHIEQLHQLVSLANEVTITQARFQAHRRSELMEHAQILQAHANDLSKVTQELNSAANHVVLNTVDKSKYTLLHNKVQQWSLKSYELTHALNNLNGGSPVNGLQLEKALIENQTDEIYQDIKELTSYSDRIRDLTCKVLEGSTDQSRVDSVHGVCDSVQKLTETLKSIVTATPANLSEKSTLSLEAAMVHRQWALKVKLLEAVLDEMSNEMAIPIDRLAGAALAVSQAKGKSRESLLDEYQNYADELSARVSKARQDCNRAMRSVPSSTPKYAVFSCVDTLCKLTPQIIAKARCIADDSVSSLDEYQDLKREWACIALQLTRLIQAVPNADKKAVADVLAAFQILKETTPQDVTQALETSIQSLPPVVIHSPTKVPIIPPQSPQYVSHSVPLPHANMQISTQLRSAPMAPTATQYPGANVFNQPMRVEHTPVHSVTQPIRMQQPQPQPQANRLSPVERSKSPSGNSRKSSLGLATHQPPELVSPPRISLSPVLSARSAVVSPDITLVDVIKPETKPLVSPHRTRPLTISSTTSTPLSYQSTISTSTYYTTDTDQARQSSGGGLDATPTPPPKPEFSASVSSLSPPDGRKWESFLGNRYSKSLAAAAMVFQQETDNWEDENNAIVKVAKTMSAQMYDMADFTRGQGPLSSKEEVINTAKAIAANGMVIVKFARIIGKFSLDQRFSEELLHCANQIPSYGKQLSIIASVKAATPEDKTTDVVLVKNAENLMEAVMKTLQAAETACVKGLKHPSEEDTGDETQATALAIQWKRKLQRHRMIEASSTETDDLGLRRINRNISAPTLREIFIHR